MDDAAMASDNGVWGYTLGEAVDTGAVCHTGKQPLLLQQLPVAGAAAAGGLGGAQGWWGECVVTQHCRAQHGMHQVDTLVSLLEVTLLKQVTLPPQVPPGAATEARRSGQVTLLHRLAPKRRRLRTMQQQHCCRLVTGTSTILRSTPA